MPANQIWVPGPWGPDLGRYAEDVAPEAPPTGKAAGKSKSKAKAKPATLTPSANQPPNGSANPDPASGGADA